VTEIRTGCISWTYPDWVGNFYPADAKSSEFLKLYSQVFDIVEVDSSFYRSPSAIMVRQWKEKTPANFLFSVKMPKRITHELKLEGIEKELSYFESSVKILERKLAAVTVQLPPFFKFDISRVEVLDTFLKMTDSKIKHAIEFRNKSWFREETYSLLRSRKACFVWSVNEYVEGMPKELTADFVYLRFMGEFGKLKKLDQIQIDRGDMLRAWWKNLEEALPKINNAYVLVSNHFAGFAPETVNQFRKLAGQKEIDWKQTMKRSSDNAGLMY
jgi:uncharacterized protein YecE (DUF72 family)